MKEAEAGVPPFRNCFWIALRRSPINGCRRGKRGCKLRLSRQSLRQKDGERKNDTVFFRKMRQFSQIYRVSRFRGSFSELGAAIGWPQLFFVYSKLPLSEIERNSPKNENYQRIDRRRPIYKWQRALGNSHGSHHSWRGHIYDRPHKRTAGTQIRLLAQHYHSAYRKADIQEKKKGVGK